MAIKGSIARNQYLTILKGSEVRMSGWDKTLTIERDTTVQARDDIPFRAASHRKSPKRRSVAQRYGAKKGK